MNLKLFVISLAFYSTTLAQKTEKYYDFSWKETVPTNATYYSVKVKTDSGWLQNDFYMRTGKLQMSALYADEATKVQNGHGHYFYANGLPSVIGQMINGKREGVYLSYHSNGMLADSALFKNGQVVDKRILWHPNGMMSDSITRVNDSTYVRIGWFEDGNVLCGSFYERQATWQVAIFPPQ